MVISGILTAYFYQMLAFLPLLAYILSVFKGIRGKSYLITPILPMFSYIINKFSQTNFRGINMKRILQFFLLAAFIHCINISAAVNDLKVQNPFTSVVKPGYMNRATLVVEPHGGYVEQSLYVEYSDKNQFSSWESRIEVVHKFELPKGSVVNDLWLWIGNNVVQARILDVWHAKKIYDSVVSSKRDPAFLSKKGDQYELRIFPMTGGQIRKIKMNFITPTQWIGNQATAELPIKFLNANNGSVKPVDVLFRTKEEVWGKPAIMEYAYQNYESLKDTMNYQYKRFNIANTAGNSTLTLLFKTDFTGGYFYESNEVKKDLTYYQIGVLPSKFFEAGPDTAKHKVLIGIDLSGKAKKNYDQVFTNIKTTLKSALRATDKFNIFLAGAGMVKIIGTNDLYATAENIDSLISLANRSPIMDSLKLRGNILFCDKSALASWSFPNIANIAWTTNFANIKTASNSFYKADAIAAYEYGYEYPLSEMEAYIIKEKIDSLMNRGGRFITYYDNNRAGFENIASKYIKGLRTVSRDTNYTILYRNAKGNMGSDFPERIIRKNTYYLTSDDPEMKVELADSYGKAAVISKRIQNGLIIVSGMWSYNDEPLLKSDENIPLLGLNSVVKNIQAFNLLKEMNNHYNTSPFDKSIIFSNSDSLISKDDAESYARSYLARYPAAAPNISTVNLLDTLIPGNMITDKNINYYGTGYFWKSISEAMTGFHFETNSKDWNTIRSILNSYTSPRLMSHTLKITADNGTAQCIQDIEVNPDAADPQKPVFHVGSTTAHTDLKFEITARYSSPIGQKKIIISAPVYHDTAKAEKMIPIMLAQENLKVLFAATPKIDTAQILDIAIKNRMLCDFTAFLALEPNDTIKFMVNPFDESGLFTGVKFEDFKLKDSLELKAFPNPFNSQTTITFMLNEPSHVSLGIYNVLGQLVKELAVIENANGRQTYHWDGKNKNNETISSGIYFARAIVKGNNSQRQSAHYKKLILMK